MKEHRHGARIAISNKPNNVSDAYRLFITASTGGGMPDRILSPPGTTTTFFLVRHAEIADSTPESPLSAAGRKRACALVDALAALDVTAIYCPTLRRNRETVQPLSGPLGFAGQTIPGWQLLDTPQFAQNFIQKAFVNLGGGVILGAGNSSAVGTWDSNL